MESKILAVLAALGNLSGRRTTRRRPPARNRVQVGRTAAGRVAAALVVALTGPVAVATDILELSVTNKDSEYRLRVAALLDAPRDAVYRIVTDYRHADRISPSILSVDVAPLEQKDAVRVQHRSRHRLGPFSLDVDWTGHIEEAANGSIVVNTVPELSSFDSGFAFWEVHAQGGRTYVLHESRLQPKFWLPPFIGGYLMKQHMREEILTTFDRIERLAKLPGPPEVTDETLRPDSLSAEAWRERPPGDG